MASPVVRLSVPEPVLAAIDEVRGEESRSAWILGAIGLRLSPVTEPVIEAATEPPGRHVRPPCPHPKGVRQKNGSYCPRCGTGGLG
jgi:hypothetical protein